MAQLYAGTSGWAYPSWKPDFYPAKLAQKNFLQHYATQLNTVEVNFTFRQLVKETTIQKWIAETPPHFRFGIKAHQVITHIKRLKKTEDFIPRFLSTIEGLARAEKLGPLLFQLPPNMKADSQVLEEFLGVLPRAVPSAFEFRHVSWFSDEIFNLLKSHNRALCVAETEERSTPGCSDCRLLLLPLSQADLHARRAPRDGGTDSRAYRAGPQRVCLFQARGDAGRGNLRGRVAACNGGIK